MHPAAQVHLQLTTAIALEVVGTMSLRLSDGFTHPWWTAAVVTSYIVSITVFSRVLAAGTTLGVAYTTLTGSGLVAATLLSVAAFGEPVSTMTLTGLTLLLVGVVVINRPARPDRPEAQK